MANLEQSDCISLLPRKIDEEDIGVNPLSGNRQPLAILTFI
jgi:hypothetical protein